VRRSFLDQAEAVAHRFRSPYQCEECGTRFWVISRKVRLRAATAVGIVLTGMLVIAGGPRLLTRDESPSSEPPPSATSSAPALTPNDISAIQQSRLPESSK
jgi:hypothetical protein